MPSNYKMQLLRDVEIAGVVRRAGEEIAVDWRARFDLGNGEWRQMVADEASWLLTTKARSNLNSKTLRELLNGDFDVCLCDCVDSAHTVVEGFLGACKDCVCPAFSFWDGVSRGEELPRREGAKKPSDCGDRLPDFSRCKLPYGHEGPHEYVAPLAILHCPPGGRY